MDRTAGFYPADGGSTPPGDTEVNIKIPLSVVIFMFRKQTALLSWLCVGRKLYLVTGDHIKLKTTD